MHASRSMDWPNQSRVLKVRQRWCGEACGITASTSISIFSSGMASPLTISPVPTVGMPLRWRPTTLVQTGSRYARSVM